MSFFIVFFFKQKTAYEMRISDWSSDVCSSDLFKNARLRFARNADAVVLHFDGDLSAFGPHGEDDMATAGGVFGGVVQQIRDDLRDADRIGMQVDGLRGQIRVQPMAPRIDQRLARLDRRAAVGGELDARAMQIQSAGPYTGNI